MEIGTKVMVKKGSARDGYQKWAGIVSKISEGSIVVSTEDGEKDCDWFEVELLSQYQARVEANIRRGAKVEMFTCSCGRTIPASVVMTSSTGHCCPECYDRMSK